LAFFNRSLGRAIRLALTVVTSTGCPEFRTKVPVAGPGRV
jgi:hypothetical protein